MCGAKNYNQPCAWNVERISLFFEKVEFKWKSQYIDANDMSTAELTICIYALADVAQWFEHWTAKQRGLTSSTPSQGTCLGCRPGPQWGLSERQPHIDVSLPFFLPSLLSKNK